MSEFDWTIPNRLRADALHRSVADWGTLTAAADEIERLREALRLTRRAMKEECDFITDELNVDPQQLTTVQ